MFEDLDIITHTWSTQPCIPPASLITSLDWCKGRKVTAAGWQVTLCDPIWHMSSHSGVVILQTAISDLLLGSLRSLTKRKLQNTARCVHLSSYSAPVTQSANHTLSRLNLPRKLSLLIIMLLVGENFI